MKEASDNMINSTINAVFIGNHGISSKVSSVAGQGSQVWTVVLKVDSGPEIGVLILSGRAPSHSMERRWDF